MYTPLNKSQHRILISIKSNQPVINLTRSHYPILKEVASKMDLQIADQFYNILWTDAALTVRQIQSEQGQVKFNHLPQITQITRKNKMAHNLNTLKIHFPKDYNFYPETWVLPHDCQRMLKRHNKDKVYIVKPENGCQGQGIFLTTNPHRLEKQRNLVVQEYISNPLLLNGLKFDLRMYVLVTCVNPLRIYLYNDGIVRCATEAFQKVDQHNIDNVFSHLTNYAINKQNQKFKADNDNHNDGHKRLISSVFKNQEYKELMSKVTKIMIKTIIAGLPAIQNAHCQCKKTDPNSFFQLLGFDILLTDKKEPILLQVNQNASLSTETNFDHKLKYDLVKNIYEMVTGGYKMSADDKTETRVKMKDKHQMTNRGNFSKIYPCDTFLETEQYDSFLTKAISLYKERFGVSLIRPIRRQKQSRAQQQSVFWHSNPQHYTQDKIEKVYSVRYTKTSIYKKRLIFI